MNQYDAELVEKTKAIRPDTFIIVAQHPIEPGFYKCSDRAVKLIDNLTRSPDWMREYYGEYDIVRIPGNEVPDPVATLIKYFGGEIKFVGDGAMGIDKYSAWGIHGGQGQNAQGATPAEAAMSCLKRLGRVNTSTKKEGA